MNKTDPNRVIDDFINVLDGSLVTLAELHKALADEPVRLSKSVSRDAFTRLAVRFEVFRSDWHVAAINRDGTAFADYHENALRQSTQRKYARAQDHVRISIPHHLPLRDIRAIVDRDGRNVTFATTKDWIERAEQHLAGEYRAVIEALPPADLKLVHAVMQIRNCLAHQSERSSNEMNSALQALSEVELVRGRQRVRPSGVDHYLRSRGFPLGQRRVVTYRARLRGIANKLKVH